MKKEREISVFSLSFIDAFCCAFGAMLMLFVLNTQALSNSVKSAVQKYRDKSFEAEKERDAAKIARQEAIGSRVDAEKARDEANKARDKAESSEKSAFKSQQLAKAAEEEALKQKTSAEKAFMEAEAAKQRSSRAMEEWRRANETIRAMNKELDEKNKRLEDANRELQTLIKSSGAKGKELEEKLNQFNALKEAYTKLEKIKNEMMESVDKLTLDKKAAEEENERLGKLLQEEKVKNAALRSRYEETQGKSVSLEDRIKEKEEQIRIKEQIIKTKEEEIRNREKEISEVEKKIKELQRQLEKKVDVSLFGIKLNYRRILLLLDKSGSIYANNWKNVLISTCEEILQNCDVEEFALVAFSSDMSYFPQTKGMMCAGDKMNKKNALDWVNKIRCGGGTHLHEALPIAYEQYGDLDAIFLLSDGLPWSRDRKSEDLEKEILDYIRQKVENGIKTKIITIAIGYPPSDERQYSEIYKYLHKICDLTGGQYLGR